MATVRPSRAPFSFWIVYRSSSAWVGCCPEPSPPLITGMATASATRLAPPVSGWRSTMQST